MSDSNVIYEAGQSFVECLKKQITPEPIALGESIGLCMPHDCGDYQLTVWIYNINEGRENGFPVGYSKSSSVPNEENYPPSHIVLSVLITAHSKAPLQSKFSDMCRVVGRAIQIVKDNPRIESKYLVGSVADSGISPMVTCLKMSHDELTKIWNNAGKPLNPSFAVEISGIYLDSTRVKKLEKRVRDASLVVNEK